MCDAMVLMTCLWYISGFLDTPVDETPASLNHFPEAVSSELICIADWLIMHNRDEYMNVYARVRATMLLKSLQQLKEQQRSSSGGSIQGVPAANSPMVVSFSIYTRTDMSCWNIFLYPKEDGFKIVEWVDVLQKFIAKTNHICSTKNWSCSDCIVPVSLF